ncbi:hypothetical protein [Gordonia zhaorongruii]|uniref:hypothetical protein n=1 Tax=Gordonia zhaorongruii TaxID=2597659 RepID=UPI0010439681|nr:hypothetical protein [Gordonia zhaorongruii]
MSDVRDSDENDRTDAWLVAATREIDEPDSDVERLITSISSGLKRIRRPARRLATDGRGIWVSDRIVKQMIAVRIRRSLGRLVVAAYLDGEADELDGIRIGLIAKYSDDLVGHSNQVRDAVEAVLISTLGRDTSRPARENIDVRWQDLYTREWLT